MAKFVIEIPDEVVPFLRVLETSAAVGGSSGGANIGAVLYHLVGSAIDGVKRPGSWEHGWLMQAFGDSWIAHTEQEPGVQWRSRPTAAELDRQAQRR